MRPSRQRRVKRVARFESVEPRLYLSGEPLATLSPDYYVESQEQYDIVYPMLSDAHALTGLTDALSEYGFTGTGQTVAVIDSGIAYDHYALGGGYGSDYRVVGGYDFAEQDNDPYDTGPYGSHGTHVAGIVGSTDSTATGVASGVDLVSLRVFDDQGQGSFAWVEQALQWVHEHQYDFENPITAITLSLGVNYNDDVVPDWAMLEDEFAQLEADGIFIAAAAGNSFTTYQEPGLTYPAVSEYVVPVASVDDNGSLSYYSQRDARVIAAPGRGILSTVPDYVGDRDGVTDDFARYSGTSMATPYVAGASVLLRQAYEFVGVDNVDQDMLYDLMISTADTVYDSVTGENYFRLNIDRALDTIMPADDFGSTLGAAYGLGTVTDTLSLDGTIGTLTDVDWFSFTAGASGNISFEVTGDYDFAPEWQTTSGSVTGSSFSMEVVAGQTYTLGLASDGLAHYSIDANLEAEVAAVDLGSIAQATFDGYTIDATGQWFKITAAADGILSVEALFANANGNVDLQVYNSNQQLVGSSQSATDGERIDLNVNAGDTFYIKAYTGSGANTDVDVRITNLVSQVGSTLRVVGTNGADSFSATATANGYQFTINGVAYSFANSSVSKVQFSGQGGSDSAVLTGSSGNDQVVMRPGSAEMTGSGYAMTVDGTESITVYGGGGDDTLVLYDSAGNDTLVATRGYAGMYAGTYANVAHGFLSMEARATAGGLDAVKFYDSAGDDHFVASPTEASMSGSDFTNRATGFYAVHAYATAGGNDLAELSGSTGDDLFVGTSTISVFYGTGFYNRAKFFEQVRADASAGGCDMAKFYDSVGNDTFVATGTTAIMYGTGYRNQASYFAGVHAYATQGGYDTATLYDSSGNDLFVGTDTASAMFSDNYYNRAKFFETVYARKLAGGNDQAYLYDSSVDDYFSATGDDASLQYDQATIWLYGFEYVRAQSTNGGNDRTEVEAVDFVLELDGAWD